MNEKYMKGMHLESIVYSAISPSQDIQFPRLMIIFRQGAMEVKVMLFKVSFFQ
jgi:hypothetical protein